MKVVRTAADLRAALRGELGSIGLVPTMGAYHAGHRSLFRAARDENDVVVASLFVNPAQFGPGEDLDRYPRDEARDGADANAAGVDVLFVPDREEMYPPGFDTWVEPGALGSVLEGAVRPGHFRGVATVCLKLFHLVRPTRAYFGRKDAQQVAVIGQLLHDLDLAADLELRILPTVRDPDGLALSSRNAFLSVDERARALALPHALQAGEAAYRVGDDPIAPARAILEAEPGLSVDYVAVADFDGPTLAAAIRVGSTRLIDNVRLAGEDSPSGRMS